MTKRHVPYIIRYISKVRVCISFIRKAMDDAFIEHGVNLMFPHPILIFAPPMTCLNAKNASFTRLTTNGIIYMWYKPLSYVWHVSFICATCSIHMCDMLQSYVQHASFVCRIPMCDIYSHVWHTSFICVICLSHTFDIPHSYVWHAWWWCVRCLLITERPKTPCHYRYQI